MRKTRAKGAEKFEGICPAGVGFIAATILNSRPYAELITTISMAEGVGFEQSETNPQPAVSQAPLVDSETLASLTASQKSVQACPELAELSQAWPKLPVNVRTAILALIRATLDLGAP